MRDTVTIFVPEGYKNSREFLDDCGFESLSVGPENVAAFNDGYAAGLEDRDEKLPRSTASSDGAAAYLVDHFDPDFAIVTELSDRTVEGAYPVYRAATSTPSDAMTDSPDILLLMEAAQGVLDANADFRSKLPDDWDGDPLEDACEELRIALGVQGGKLATRPSPAPAAVEALEDAETWCEMQARAIGNVDGYDYRSGEEAAYRHAAIELKKRAAALSQSRNEGKTHAG